MAEKSAKILDEIAASKATQPRAPYLCIRMRFVGERTGQLLAEYFSSLQKLADASAEQLEKCPKSVRKLRAALRIFSRAREPEINSAPERARPEYDGKTRAPEDTRFAGMTFVFTGALAASPSRRGRAE